MVNLKGFFPLREISAEKSEESGPPTPGVVPAVRGGVSALGGVSGSAEALGPPRRMVSQSAPRVERNRAMGQNQWYHIGWMNIHLPAILMFTRVQGFDP